MDTNKINIGTFSLKKEKIQKVIFRWDEQTAEGLSCDGSCVELDMNQIFFFIWEN